MTRKARAAPAPNPTESDPLATAVERLAEAVIILRDTVDAVREDISWLSRNGMPIQPIEHVVVKRMALDPCAADWRDRLQLQRTTFPPEPFDSSLDADTCDRIAEELKATFDAVAQGQLEVVLTALDGVRAEILAAVNRRRHTVPATVAPPISEESMSPGRTVDELRRPSEPGRLF